MGWRFFKYRGNDGTLLLEIAALDPAAAARFAAVIHRCVGLGRQGQQG
jgi:hypothetical protein